MQPRLNSEPTLEEFLSDCIKDATHKGGLLQVPQVRVTKVNGEHQAHTLLSYHGKEPESFIYRVPADSSDEHAEDNDLLGRIDTFLKHPLLSIERVERTYTLTSKKRKFTPKDVLTAFSIEGPIADMLNEADPTSTLTLKEVYAVARSAGLNDTAAQEQLLQYIAKKD